MENPVCWNLTGACNRKCVYCFRELCEQAQSLKTNINVLNNLKKSGVTRITFSGGEPYMYPSILELIERAHRLGIHCYVVTNGSGLTENTFVDYLKYIERLSFSCDSPDPVINQVLERSKDSYEHIKKILPYIRSEYPKEKLDIQINTVFTNSIVYGIDELDVMFNAINNDLFKYDISTWKIIQFYPLRGYAKYNKEILEVNDEIWEKVKEKVKVNISPFKIDFRDIASMDRQLIVSPSGLLKKSDNGVERVLKDLKIVDCKSSGYKKGGVKHV